MALGVVSHAQPTHGDQFQRNFLTKPPIITNDALPAISSSSLHAAPRHHRKLSTQEASTTTLFPLSAALPAFLPAARPPRLPAA
eukprot:6172490-Pleurochrysis_carterae.AAC.1